LKFDFDFVAPVVSSVSDVSDLQVGLIVFEVSTNQYKAYTGGGIWTAMTVPVGSPVSSSGSSERLERLTFGDSGGTECTTSPCVQLQESGNWVTTAIRNSTGNYSVTFATAFDNIPTCTCSSTGGNAQFCSIITVTAADIDIVTSASVGGSQDGLVQLICMGER
jgi:hypothetical protein